MSAESRLQLWDYVSLSALVFLSSLVGFYQVFSVRKSKVTKDFLVTSRDLGLFPLTMSATATYLSAISMMGFPIEVYMTGLSFTLVCFPFLLFAPLGSHLFLPVFFKLNRNTIYEYLELRFCRSVRLCTSFLQSLQVLLYTAIVMYAPSLALSQVTGIHLWTSVGSIGVACILYTSMGGIKAVVWADLTQFLVMIGVFLLIIAKSYMDVGGFHVVWERLSIGNRTQFFVWSSSPYTQYSFWSIFIAHSFHFLSTFTVNQSMMQRNLSNSTLKRAQITYWGATFGVTMGQLVYMVEGALLYAYYFDCDPLLSGKIGYRDQLMALFALDVLSFCKGLSGVFVAGIMCATLSTLSSMLNSLTAVTLSDFIKTFKPDLSNETSIKLSKYLAVVFGVVAMALVALIENMGGVIKAAFGIGGMMGGPIFTIFTIGMLFPSVTSKGAVISLLCSTIFPAWSFVGNAMRSKQLPHAPLLTSGCLNQTLFPQQEIIANATQNTYLDDFYDIPSFWYVTWSLATGVIVALIYTKVTGGQDMLQVDPDLVFPFISKKILKKKQLRYNKNKLDLERIKNDERVIKPLLMSEKEEEHNYYT